MRRRWLTKLRQPCPKKNPSSVLLCSLVKIPVHPALPRDTPPSSLKSREYAASVDNRPIADAAKRPRAAQELALPVPADRRSYVDEDETRGIKPALMRFPARAAARNAGTIHSLACRLLLKPAPPARRSARPRTSSPHELTPPTSG